MSVRHLPQRHHHQVLEEKLPSGIEDRAPLSRFPLRHPRGVVFCSRDLLFSFCNRKKPPKPEQSEMQGQEVFQRQERRCRATDQAAKVAGGNLVHRVFWSPSANSWGHVSAGHRKEREIAFRSLLEKTKALPDTPILCPIPERAEGHPGRSCHCTSTGLGPI